MSNGSERTPERCVHAVDGPDWAGLRELPTPKPDYEALIEETRGWAEREADELGQTSYSAWTLQTLADAVEALVAERDALRAQLDSATATPPSVERSGQAAEIDFADGVRLTVLGDRAVWSVLSEQEVQK